MFLSYKNQPIDLVLQNNTRIYNLIFVPQISKLHVFYQKTQ